MDLRNLLQVIKNDFKGAIFTLRKIRSFNLKSSLDFRIININLDRIAVECQASFFLIVECKVVTGILCIVSRNRTLQLERDCIANIMVCNILSIAEIIIRGVVLIFQFFLKTRDIGIFGFDYNITNHFRNVNFILCGCSCIFK